jgi:hypothetical protein
MSAPAPTPAPIIPADADPIEYVQALRFQRDVKHEPSKLRKYTAEQIAKAAISVMLLTVIAAPRAANDEGPNAPACAMRIAA